MTSPAGTGTSPYGYPSAGSDQSRSGELVYKSKNSLTAVASHGEICFKVDDAYVNVSPDQIFTDIIRISLGESTDAGEDLHKFSVKESDALSYGFYVDQATEIISKGGTTSILEISNAGSGRSLTEANSKTSVQIIYPKDIELVSLEETDLYKTNGTVEDTVIDGDNKISTVTWNEPGSYSGGLNFKPHLKVASDSGRPNGSSFNVSLKNFRKTIWNDSPNADRTSGDQTATVKVTIIDGENPEKLTTHALVDSAPNWSYKKYDTYNVRLGAFLIKNELQTPTKPKTLEMTIDEGDTAIIRGVTIPYHKDMTYGKILWTASDGKSGEADPSILVKNNVSALITNTALGLDANTSIKSVKVDLGVIPAGYDGIKPMQDLLDTWNPDNKHVYDEFYGWGYISNGVYGTWKKGTNADVKTSIKFHTTGETPDQVNVTIGKSGAPEILNGVGTIDKTQVLGGDAFKISGRINDANWDWNPMQEPVLYIMMPEGFSYSNLNITNGDLGSPEYIGAFDKNGIQIEVWKYNIDIGTETRGQYQPDFKSVSMALSMDVSTDKRAAVGTYHINDFVGITTKNFKDIGAVIKSEHWDRSNWNTSKYTKKDKDPDKLYDIFNGKVNDGETMVSLSESKGVMVKQANEVLASTSFLTVDKDNKTKRYDYDNTSEDSKKATTAVLKKGDDATMHIVVRNNTTSVVDHVSLYVPLLNDGLDLGQSFMPEGRNELPMQLKAVKASSNYTIEYLKVRDGKSYNLNEAPVDSDCEVVSDVSEANMIRFVSKKVLSVGDGGTIDVTFAIADDLPYSYNGKRNVITPVLDYDINGNKSTLTKEPAAITYEADKPDPTTSTTTEPTTESTTSTRPSETETTGTETAATAANVTAETVRNSGKIVKTGDENNINKFIIVAIIAGGAILTSLIAVTKKRKM